MNARRSHEEARRFLEHLRAHNQAALGISSDSSALVDRADPSDTVNRFLRESLHPEDARDPEIRALVEQHFARSHHGNDEMLAGLQDNIEQTAAARIKGVDLAPLSPLIGYLQTGQLNAVSMRVPGRSGDYLVLFEDEMLLFASKLSKAVAWAIPAGPSDANGMMTFEWGMPPVTERIEARPEVAEQFADIVITYAVTGGVGQAAHHMVPPGYLNLASMMRDSLEYFVLGHEYSHILLGHLDIAESRKGVLPAGEAEVLAYSWRQELDADWFGMVLSINALIDHEDQDIPFGFIGISLFFDALDVMDRAVALLQTGDENARQLGSHPPSDLRKRYLRDFLPQMAGGDPELSEDVRTALELADVQSEIIRLLWERTRPILLDLRRHGVSVAPTWRTIPKEAGDETVPGP